MRREKNKNRVKANEEEESETDEPIQTDVPSPLRGEGDSLIDADGQNHNIDNAIQQYSSLDTEQNMHIDSENTEYSDVEMTNHPDDAVIYTADGETIANDQRNAYQTTTYAPLQQPTVVTPSPPPLPPLPQLPPLNFAKESMFPRPETIEISSDGSSGHLTPGRIHR